MASGFGGRYQGSVVDDADPIGEHRLRVIVPEVWGTEAGAWAVPSLPPGGAATPAGRRPGVGHVRGRRHRLPDLGRDVRRDGKALSEDAAFADLPACLRPPREA
jgi:hypothetical protein